MKHLRWLAMASFTLLSACEPKLPITVMILDSGQIRTVITHDRLPTAILTQAGITLGPADRVMLSGTKIQLDQPIPSSKTYTMQIRRAATLNINGMIIQSSALTVGEALSNTGTPIFLEDKFNAPVDTPITGATTINYVPSQDLLVTMDERQIHIRSTARTIGAALAEAGLPLLELDTSQPSENEALPQDGQVHIIRVSESVVLAQKSIPFKSEFQSSAEVELDHQDVLQPGQPGLIVSRTRIRFEDGKEIVRQTESETVVRSPKNRVVGYGTKVATHTAIVDGIQIKYWRAVQMFTTAYSPCNSGGDRCYSGTSSGKTVQKGVTAVKYSWYLNMQGQAIFIPGYGYATIEDVCGGCVGKPWIDLGYTDAQFQQEGSQWGKYVTVYFLAPPPPNILFVLE